MKAIETKREQPFERTKGLLEEWRRKGRPGKFIPAEVWKQAVDLAQEHGVSRTATALRIHYGDLRKRVDGAARPDSDNSPQRFVELPAADLLGGPECLVEAENDSGTRLRVSLRGKGTEQAAAVIAAVWGKA